MRIISLTGVIGLLLPGLLAAQDFSGVVVKIADGDSMTVLTTQSREIEVRLADIDAPERGQPFADRARQALGELVFQKTVEVRFNDADTYGRIVGRVYTEKIDVSAEMLRRGLAWVYRSYVRDQSLFAIETEAREAHRGLWAAREEPIPPWEWRRNARPSAPGPGQVPMQFTCGSKQYCREMASCEEARFHLRQCGITTLDGDDDGVPCENICRSR